MSHDDMRARMAEEDRIARLWKRPRGPARQWLPPGAPDRPIQLALVDLRRELARVRERLDRL